MSAIASIASLSAQPNASPTGAHGAQTMDFMKLLMAQMRNQNPMEPQNGNEFMTQIAQFNQLDGINKLNQNFSDMLALQSMSQGANLIGKTVAYDKDGTGNTARGTVGSVRIEAGKVQLMISGVAVNLSQVRGIETGPRPA